MRTYIIKRIFLMIPTFFGVSLVVWFILTAAPEPPASAQAPGSSEEGQSAGEAGGMSQSVKVFRAQYGLDKPPVLNFYYRLKPEKVRTALQSLLSVDEELKARKHSQEQLINWGYYSVPALVSLLDEEQEDLRTEAMRWLVNSAQRIAVGAETGRVDPETTQRNTTIVIENKILDLYAWSESDPASRKEAGRAALKAWYFGARSRYPTSTVHPAKWFDENENKILELGSDAVPTLVELVRSDDERRDRAAALLIQCVSQQAASSDDPTATSRAQLEAEALGKILWKEGAPPPRKAAGAELIRLWWEGTQGNWAYDSRWLKIMLFETRFAQYWGNLLRFDLGYSTAYKVPVLLLIYERLKVSLTLAVSSLLLAYFISIPLGMLSARIHGSLVERAMGLVVFALYSLPSFFVATMVVRYVAMGQPTSLEWIPDGRYDSMDSWRLSTWAWIKDVAWHTAAPIACMTYGSFAALSRYAKSGLLNVMRSDYVRTARAKGLHEFVVTTKHAGRNGIIPVITLLGTTLPTIVGGSFIIEFIFSIPGFGLLTVNAIFARDYNVIIGVTLLVAVLTMVGILLSDLLYAIVDPRISFS